MRLTGVALLAPNTLLALATCVYGGYEWLHPPFTDAQLTNLVDTWQPHAYATTVVLALLAIVFVTTLAIAIAVRRQPTRSMALSTSLLAVAGALLLVRNHAALTHRVTELTGQTFGGWNGLGLF